MNYTHGLLIGRFQPFHNGHAHLIHESLKHIDHLAIAIGSAHTLDEQNPYDLQTRMNMIEAFTMHDKLSDRITSVTGLDDVPDDQQWLKIVQKALGPFEVVVSNNDWVTGIFNNAGYPTISIPLYMRHIYEGARVRHGIRNNLPVHESVPSYIHKLLSTD